MLTLVDSSAIPRRKLSSNHILLIIFPAYCTFKIPFFRLYRINKSSHTENKSPHDHFVHFYPSESVSPLKPGQSTLVLYHDINNNIQSSPSVSVALSSFPRKWPQLHPDPPTSTHPPTSFPNSAELLHYPPLAGVSLQAGPALPPMTGKPGSDRLVQVSGTARTDGRGQRRTNNKGALLFSSSGWLGSPVLHEQDKPPPHQHHQHHLPSSLRTPASRAM